MKLIFIHGIGNQKSGYSNGLYQNISKQWGGAKGISAGEILWTDLTRPTIEEYTKLFEESKERNGWGALFEYEWAGAVEQFTATAIRPLILQVLYYARYKDRILSGIHDKITPLITKEKDVALITHSLGTVIGFDYVVGRNPAYQLSRSVERRLFVTMGSPLPFFNIDVADRQADFRLFGKWTNFFDAGDPIASPCGLFFPKAAVRDRAVKAGVGLAAHTGYWTNDEVAKGIAEMLLDVFQQGN